jgi:hypothetical protein
MSIALSYRNVELIQRQREAIACCLDVGFLPRPASEKGSLQFISFETPQGLYFAFGEKALRQPFRVDCTPYVFHVYSDCPLLHKSHKRETVSVGYVEAQATLSLKDGLAPDRISETHVLRRVAKILSQQDTQRCARQDKFVAGPFDPESKHPLLFFPRKQLIACAHFFGRGIKPALPQMHNSGA